jgi:DNA-binding NarL/FixJ family response regulator
MLNLRPSPVKWAASGVERARFPATCNAPTAPLRDAPEVALRCAIVDDKPEFLEAARNLLERQGVAVVGLVSTAADAVDRVQELAPDVALVDVDLGDASGFEIARRLAGTPVILISAYDEEDFAELLAESPAAGFLSKSALSRRAISDLLNGR